MIRYEECSWKELEKHAKKKRVVLIPVGTLEDHGYHLPINTDVLIPKTILTKVAEVMPDKTILFPEVVHGYSPHHMDFSGTTYLEDGQFVEYLLSVTGSLAHHGFNRMFILNGHGSNEPLCTTVQMKTNRRYKDVVCMNAFYLTSKESLNLIQQVRKSEYPGGMGHACELETSLMLAIRPDLVQMNKAVKEIRYPKNIDANFMDWADGPLKYMPLWNEISVSGVQGDPTVASAETGKILLEQAVKESVKWVNVVLHTRRNSLIKRH